MAAPRWQRRPADRRQEILAAAMLVFGEEGYAKATLAQVARKAGISAATVSHYFGSKAALFEAMVSEEAMVISDDDPLLLVGPDGFRGLLHQLVDEKLERLNRPDMARLTLTVLREMHTFPAFRPATLPAVVAAPPPSGRGGVECGRDGGRVRCRGCARDCATLRIAPPRGDDGPALRRGVHQ
ncbi:MAG: TetR/AcrR family transcriptional regulator [Gemmatimonadetes bacterium]|nr:TetR/AcrR family transcriptional regulator [Gemmatimonadota bacterium]